MRRSSLLAILALWQALSICSDCARAATYTYTIPEKTNDGWETAALESVKLDGGLIASLCDKILADEYKNIHCVLVVKDGKLVVEEYFPRQSEDSRERALKRVAPQQIFSATKSVNSILVGIAIDRHLISGVDEKVSTFFPEYANLLADGDKSNLRLKDLLTMTAGFSWDEWSTPYSDGRNEVAKMIFSPDPLRFLFERPLDAAPGKKFSYNSGNAVALGEIIYKATHQRADKFADQFLFGPLGIIDYYWSKLPDDLVETSGGLFLRPRDMAKIGSLYLNGGRWKGRQIVSQGWVNQSTTNAVDPKQIPAAAHADGYGYGWWLNSFHAGDRTVDSYSARGRGGQFIVVFPKQQMVMVFTGWNDNATVSTTGNAPALHPSRRRRAAEDK